MPGNYVSLYYATSATFVIRVKYGPIKILLLEKYAGIEGFIKTYQVLENGMEKLII